MMGLKLIRHLVINSAMSAVRALWPPLPVLKTRSITWSLIFLRGDRYPYQRENAILRKAE